MATTTTGQQDRNICDVVKNKKTGSPQVDSNVIKVAFFKTYRGVAVHC